MADILPIRGWRYNETLGGEIGDITSPLFDVVSGKQREKLYKNPFSSIHLSVPQGENPAEEAKKTLDLWKNEGIILQDKLPSIYVYYQYFSLPGSVSELCRKGFIANVRVHDFDENVILRHENTIPHSVNDRLELLEKTELNVSPTHGLYSDDEFTLEKYMDDAMKFPIYETEDYQGVKDVMAVIQDRHVIQKFIEVIAAQKIILADGHHRYQGSLEYFKKKKAENPEHTGKEGYNFHSMYLTNTESDHLRIMPTHRLIHDLENFNEEEIMRQLSNYFVIKTVEDTFTINEVITGKKWTYGLIFKDNAYIIRLKPEKVQEINWKFPDIIKQLDLTIIHYFLIEKILGIKGIDQRKTENVTYDRSFSDCYGQVLKGEAQMAVIVNEISIETVKNVCYSGFTLPQKSTYFYPKVISGYLYSSINEEDFKFPFDLRF